MKKENHFVEWVKSPKGKMLIKTLKEFAEIMKITQHDVDEIEKKLNKEPQCQLWRRLYVRSVYSFIEAFSYRLMDISYKYAKDEKELSLAEIAMTREESYYLTKNGSAKSRGNYQESSKRLRFAFKIFAKALNLNLKLRVHEKGWAAYKDGLKIRNRITHPKSPADLKVADKEIKKIHELENWFKKTIDNLYVELKRVQEILKEMYSLIVEYQKVKK